MQISRLKISGFKSFAQPVELFFKAKEITAVVGPNGCGKSNIVDAIRWVLGEQSPRQLRGDQMSDVIFSGSEFRKPSGMAEVTLTFTNLQGSLLEKYKDYTELAITRRLLRSGDSSYLINKTPVRLMDIRELFMDSGIGTGGYSIVEQGKVANLLNARPVERRHLIEEAAGIVKFQVKRQNAEKRMEATRHNLIRVQDILEELQQQETKLSNQVKTAHRYTALEEEIHQREQKLSVQRWGTAKEQEVEALKCLKTEEQSLEQSQHQQSLLETELQKSILQQTQHSARMEEAHHVLFQKEQQIQEADNSRKMAEQSCHNLKEQLQRHHQDQKEAQETLKNHQQMQTESETALKTLKTRHQSLQAEMDRIAEDRDDEESLFYDLDSKAQEHQSELLNLHTELTSQSNNQHFLEERLTGLSERLTRIRSQITLNQEALATLETQKETSLLHLNSAQTKQKQMLMEIQELQKQQKVHKQAVLQSHSELHKIQYQHNTHASRLESLLHIQERHEDFGDSVKKFLKTLQSHAKIQEQLGILGVLADFISITEEHLPKLAPFLSEMLEWIVVQDSKMLPQIEQFCHKHHCGGLTFVPLKTLWEKQRGIDSSENSSESSDTSSTIQSLASFVNLDASISEWGNAFFGRICLIPEDDHSWKEIFDATSQRHKVEEWISPLNTHITAHVAKIPLKTKSSSSGYLHRKNEIQSLKTKTIEAQALVQQLQKEQKSLLKDQELWDEKLRILNAQKHEQDLELLHQRKEQEQVQREFQRTQQQCKQLKEDNLRVQKEEQSLKERHQKTLEKLTSLSSSRAMLEAELEEQREQVQEQKAVVDALSESFFAQKIDATELSEQLKNQEQNTGRLHKEIRNLEKKLETHCSFQNTADEEFQKQTTIIQEIRDSYDSLLIERQKFQSQLEKIREEQAVLLEIQQNKTETLQKTRKTLGECSTQLHATQLKLSESQMKLKQISEDFEEALKLRNEAQNEEDAVNSEGQDLLEFLLQNMDWKLLNATQLAQELKYLRSKLRKMTHVNLGAPEEYQELKERLESIRSQVQDLEQALGDLKKMIHDINTESRRRFRKAFAQINKRFQELFTTLFEGGSAQMILTDSDDVLEAGIEILAQPPGKHLQNLNLLSGGEKALTAISLIFSTFLIKPTPFCLLDEVDAPLDDANVARLNHLLQKLISYSQFIIVTHNKKTMEIAKTLYGITMEEAGVSKSISVEFQ